MQIGKHSVVTIDYHLTAPDGQVIDSSRGKQPLTYLHGVGGIIPGLEAALVGKTAGESIVAVIPPDQGYGQKDPKMIQAVPRTAFQGVADIQPGMQFQAQSPQGPRVVTVVAVTDSEVTVDANHPLAGMQLKFEVDVKDVRDASDEEIQHGHVHGPGGHHHH